MLEFAWGLVVVLAVIGAALVHLAQSVPPPPEFVITVDDARATARIEALVAQRIEAKRARAKRVEDDEGARIEAKRARVEDDERATREWRKV